jgi:hypothetical protein
MPFDFTHFKRHKLNIFQLGKYELKKRIIYDI